MHPSVRKCVLMLGVVSLACGGEPTKAPLTSNASIPAVVVITPPANSNIFVGQSISLIAAVKNAAGAQVFSTPVVWSTSDASVATISSSGVLTAVGSGSVTITGTAGGLSASIVLTVKFVPVKTLSISVKGSIWISEVAPVTWVAIDTMGNTVVGRNVSWTSRNAAVATVSTNGQVAGISAGAATIEASIDGVIASATVNVAKAPLVISVSTPTNALLVNDQMQATAIIKDTLGNTITTVPPAWTSSAPARVSVSPAGVVTQIQGGPQSKVTIFASLGGVTASAVIPLMGHAVEAAPALPAVFLNTAARAAPDVGGVVRSVSSSSGLQAALDAAQPGDVVELAAGLVFTGNYVLKAKSASTKWITIRPSNYASLPAEGSRMTPTIAAALHLPRIETATINNAIGFAAGANHYRITGIEVGLKVGVPLTYALINTESATGQKTLA
ncbi:MAG: Ig-like domain-containing protein, partial [bacterium]